MWVCRLCSGRLYSSGYYTEKMEKVLLVPTGALLSKVSFNEGDPIPGIAHAVVIEQYRVPDMM